MMTCSENRQSRALRSMASTQGLGLIIRNPSGGLEGVQGPHIPLMRAS